MNHIKDYFTGTVKKIFEKKAEKDLFIQIILDVTGVSLNKNEITIKDGNARITVFGIKRSLIISHRNKILEEAQNKGFTLQNLN